MYVVILIANQFVLTTVHIYIEILWAGIIAKYYVQVMRLFVYNRSWEIFGNAQETFLFTVEKNKHRRLRS